MSSCLAAASLGACFVDARDGGGGAEASAIAPLCTRAATAQRRCHWRCLEPGDSVFRVTGCVC
eukprot:4859845-Prymnesium_polylepis.1